MKHLLAIALMCACWCASWGQDVHFTQFAESPLNLNPANAGHFEGDWRISNNYRRQWAMLGDPFVTAAIGFDVPLDVFGHKVGVGGWILNDVSGALGLNVFQANLQAAYHKKLGMNRLRGGLQVSYVAKSFSTNNLSFPDQFEWDAGVFNPALATSATGFGQQSSFVDLSAGIGWSRRFRTWTPDIGLSFQHLNQPNDAFFSTANNLPMRTTVNAAATFDLNETWYLWPRVLYLSQASATQTALSSFVGYRLPQNKANVKSVYLGPAWRTGINRNSDAVAGVAGIRFKNLQLGFSYDYTISSLGPAIASRGALEFSLIYIPNPVVTKISIPCDRY